MIAFYRDGVKCLEMSLDDYRALTGEGLLEPLLESLNLNWRASCDVRARSDSEQSQSQNQRQSQSSEESQNKNSPAFSPSSKPVRSASRSRSVLEPGDSLDSSARAAEDRAALPDVLRGARDDRWQWKNGEALEDDQALERFSGLRCPRIEAGLLNEGSSILDHLTHETLKEPLAVIEWYLRQLESPWPMCPDDQACLVAAVAQSIWLSTAKPGKIDDALGYWIGHRGRGGILGGLLDRRARAHLERAAGEVRFFFKRLHRGEEPRAFRKVG